MPVLILPLARSASASAPDGARLFELTIVGNDKRGIPSSARKAGGLRAAPSRILISSLRPSRRLIPELIPVGPAASSRDPANGAHVNHPSAQCDPGTPAGRLGLPRRARLPDSGDFALVSPPPAHTRTSASSSWLGEPALTVKWRKALRHVRASFRSLSLQKGPRTSRRRVGASDLAGAIRVRLTFLIEEGSHMSEPTGGADGVRPIRPPRSIDDGDQLSASAGRAGRPRRSRWLKR